MSMLYDEDDDEELNFYGEDEGSEETPGTPETPESSEPPSTGGNFNRQVENPLFRNSFLQRLLISDPTVSARLREEAREERAKRRRTNHRTGYFWLDVLVMLTLSPSRFKAGCKTWQEFIHLGDCVPDKDDQMPDWDDCEWLYQRKKDVFLISILSWGFLLPALTEGIAAYAFWRWGASVAIRLVIQSFTVWRLIKAFVLSEVVWNIAKILLKLLLSVMSVTTKTVLKEKEDYDKAQKARKAAEKKAQKAAEKQARKKTSSTTTGPVQPLPPSGRGRRCQSGG